MEHNIQQNLAFFVKPTCGRLGARKSKTGCLTCKARKVKCDETKPACRRCITANRLCQGYTDVFVTTRVVDAQYARNRINSLLAGLSVRTPSRSPSPLASEGRALQYYEVNIAKILGGAIDTEFWTRSILQMSETEPAIQQALIAVSDLWETQTMSDQFEARAIEQRSITTYNKALAMTAQRITEPEADTVALATCVLFLCLHCLQADKEQTVKLLQSGSGVLFKVMHSLYESPAQRSTAKMFLPIFERMLIHLRLFGERMPPFRSPEAILYSDMEEHFSQFEGLSDARNALFWLVTETHELIVRSAPYRLAPDPGGLLEREYMQQQELQLSAFAMWLQGFEQLCATTNGNANLVPHKAVLRLTHAVTYTWLATCFCRDVLAIDDYHDQFEIAVQEAEKVVAHKYDIEDNSPFFTFEMGVIPNLYLTILSCRDYGLRQRALSVLQKAPVREGLWEREQTLRVARRVVQLEHSGSEIVAGGHIFRDARICDTQIKSSDEEGTHVSFAAKLNGQEALWLVWDETIPWTRT